MAPEVMDVPLGEKSGSFGRKVDIFSLGAVFYFLTFQSHAFVGRMYHLSRLPLPASIVSFLQPLLFYHFLRPYSNKQLILLFS